MVAMTKDLVWIFGHTIQGVTKDYSVSFVFEA
jgi:hypothetical protein